MKTLNQFLNESSSKVDPEIIDQIQALALKYDRTAEVSNTFTGVSIYGSRADIFGDGFNGPVITVRGNKASITGASYELSPSDVPEWKIRLEKCSKFINDFKKIVK